MSGRAAALLAVASLTVLTAGGVAVLWRRAVTREATTADVLLAGFTLYGGVLAGIAWTWLLFFGGKFS